MSELLKAIQRHKTQDCGFVCPICGKVDYVPSAITIEASYGSIHDGKTVKAEICGECLDRLISAVGLLAVTMSENGLTTGLF
jgi:transcription elongation factor Elf1